MKFSHTKINETLKGERKMKTVNSLKGWLLAAAIIVAGFTGHSQAATSDNIDIHVSINGAKSVTVSGTTFYDFGALNVNTSSVSATAIVVQNDSTVFIETYTITGDDALTTTGGTDWQLEASTGPDQYALAAQFSTSRPNDLNGDWGQDALEDGVASTCNQDEHGNGTEAQGGSNVAVGANRNLWFRLKTPSSVTDSAQHDITVTVSVL